MPSIDNLVILAAVLGVTIDQLIVVDGDSDGDGDNPGKGNADLHRSAIEKCLQQILVYDS